MEDELRLSLLVLGSCFIVAVLAHGIWKIRRNNQSKNPGSRKEPSSWNLEEQDELANEDITWDEAKLSASQRRHHQEQQEQPDYDDLGLGKVRVINPHLDRGPEQDDSDDLVPETDQSREETAGDEAEDTVEPTVEPAAEPAVKLYGSVVTNPKPHMQHSGRGNADPEDEPDFPEPPGFLLKTGDAGGRVPGSDEATVRAADPELDDFSLDSQPAPPAPAATSAGTQDDAEEAGGFGEQAKRLMSRKRSKSSQKRRQEPSFGDDQMRIDFEQSESALSDFDEPQEMTSEEPAKPQQSGPAPEQEVLVLNVRAPEEEPISGAALLPLLLTLGFKFGDQDIFHRHVNSNGKGPVLFSLANMFKPGVFDIDNLETFSTQGISLFMILPIEGDAHQVFNMMHNAARKIADEFNAQVLDGRRSVLTKQGLQQYMEKIREFERQRIISRQ